MTRMPRWTVLGPASVIVVVLLGLVTGGAGAGAQPIGQTAAAALVPSQVPANQPPVASDHSIATTVNTATTIDLSTGWSDPEGGPVTLQSSTQGSAGGAVSCTVAGSCRYTPPAGFTGTDSFTYTVVDQDGMTGLGTVTVSITNPNRPPVAGNSTLTVQMNTSGSIELGGTWSDPDGDTVTLQFADQGVNGGQVNCSASGSCSYSPPGGYAGPDSFSYSVVDSGGLSDTGTVSVTVARPPNRRPVAPARGLNTRTNTPTVIDLSANWSDPDGDRVSLRSATGGTRGGRTGCSSTGACSYTPPLGFSGTESFSYTVVDPGGLTATGRVTVTVTATSTSTPTSTANRPPVAGDDLIQTVMDKPGSVNLLRNDHDPDGDALRVSIIGRAGNGRVVCNGGICVYTPSPTFSGITNFVYTIVDGKGGSDEGQVNIVVASRENRAPVAINDVIRTDVDKPVPVQMLANDKDPDPGDIVKFVSATKPAHGTVDCHGAVCTYAPTAGFLGTDSFTYTISDQAGTRDTAVVTIGVGEAPDNLPPQGRPDELHTLSGLAKVVDVLRNDSDPDRGDKLSIRRAANPANGTVKCTKKRCTYTPDAGFVGVDTFTYVVTDGHGAEDTALVTARVDAVKPSTSLTLDPQAPSPGSTTTATGAGCAPLGPVSVTVAGEVIRGQADPAGRFRIPVTVPHRAAGRYPAVAKCGTTVLKGPLDIAILTAGRALHMSTLVLIVALLLLLALLQSQLPWIRTRGVPLVRSLRRRISPSTEG